MTVKPQGHKWRKLTHQFRTQAHQRNDHCWLCGKPIDWTAPPQSPMAFEIDHALPRATHPHLAYETTNLRTAHSACNRRRGNTPPAIPHKAFGWTPANW